MRVAQKSGITKALARLAEPLLSKLFGGLEKGGRAMQYITLNLTANLLGLGNASTPLGLAAMKEIEREEKPQPADRASHGMILFAVMNTASMQLIPTTAAALRLKYGSQSPMEILPCVWISSVCALTAAVAMTFVFKKIFDRKRMG